MKILISVIANVLDPIEEKLIKQVRGYFFVFNNFNEQFIICQHRRTRQVVSFLACKRDLYFVLKSMFAAVKWVKYKLHRNCYTSLSKKYAVGHQNQTLSLFSNMFMTWYFIFKSVNRITIFCLFDIGICLNEMFLLWNTDYDVGYNYNLLYVMTIKCDPITC